MIVITSEVIFYLCLFIIFWAMIGYPVSIKLLGKISSKKINKNYLLVPSVTIMVVAHNEEDVIQKKLENLTQLNYPNEKIKILVSSDNSTDNTNDIVKDFIRENERCNIELYEVKKRLGKTNAQNEAQKIVDTEFLVMTDANSMLDKNAIKELMATFTSDNIGYVCGELKFVNKFDNDISAAESGYWDKDLEVRRIESRIQTITAGNGALYACRNKDYQDFELILSHDTAMPLYFALNGKRALSDEYSIVYEKAGENSSDEFGRKVRMNRVLLKNILPKIEILNFFKLSWFTYFYIGHRTSRYLLWISHLLLFISSGILAFNSIYFLVLFLGQVLFYMISGITKIFNIRFKPFVMIYYYTLTILAQFVGVYKTITKQNKPFWEKAESTR